MIKFGKSTQFFVYTHLYNKGSDLVNHCVSQRVILKVKEQMQRQVSEIVWGRVGNPINWHVWEESDDDE